MAEEKYKVVFLDNTSPVFQVPASSVTQFQYQSDQLPQGTLVMNGQSFTVEDQGGNLVFDPGGPNQRIFTKIGEIIQFQVGSTTFQFIYQGNRDEEFYVTDSVWSLGRYSAEPRLPEEPQTPTSAVWTLSKP